MKKTTTSSETPVAKDKAEKSTTTKATKKTTEKPATTKATKTTTEASVVIEATKTKPEASIIVEVAKTTPVAPVAVEVTKTTPKKTSPKSKPTTVAPVVESELIVTSPEIAMHERIGLTAGSIWHYLAENGATSVAKLVDALPETEEIIQRSIGWLAQEAKITLSVVEQVETIALQ